MTDSLSYEAALEWIHAQLKFGIKPGIKRMAWFLEELGHPERDIQGIHVVGTNGKGSTVTYMRQIYQAAGYDVGTFTSPFITEFRERISVNGVMMEKDALVELVELVKPLAERLPEETELGTATEFELITVIMFVYFARRRPVDVVLVEAGLGGLYDSTNVFEALALVCPSIGLDHQDILGESYREIAQQKAGALHAKEPFLYYAEREDVQAVFEGQAQRTASPSLAYGRDFEMVADADGSYRFVGLGQEIPGLKPAMPGQHQVRNAGLAVATVLYLQDHFPAVRPDHIRQGLAQAFWQGRTELIRPNLMLDGAHNRESVEALTAVLENYRERPIKILFAAINTKPVNDMLAALAQSGQVTVTSFDYPKAYDLADYPEAFPRGNSWKSWLDQAIADDSETFYLVTGSLYFISQVRAYILETESEMEE